MEEKNKSGQITFGTYAVIVTIVFLVLLVGILAVMLIQKNNEEKGTNATENIVSNTKNEITENVIDSTSENKIDKTIQKENNEKENINDTTNNSNEEISKEDKKDIEDTIKKYYELLEKKEEEPASMLDELGFTVEAVQDPDYAPSGYVEYPNGEYMWTGIKYNDFIGEIWYITEDIVKSQFKEFVEYKGYLYITESFNKSCEYTIKSMDLKEGSKNKCTYLVKVKKSNNSKTYTQEITLGRGNGDFVIMKINDK